MKWSTTAIVKNDLFNISTGMLEMADDESIQTPTSQRVR
jgi:hypothetical protein